MKRIFYPFAVAGAAALILSVGLFASVKDATSAFSMRFRNTKKAAP